MKRSFTFKQPNSPRRPLKVYAFDPMLGRRQGGRITLDIPNEHNLRRGPTGERIEVIDYDGANDILYSPVDLNDQAILMQNGLDPTESDPRFHQQMVYAVAMKVLENFDIALGRKLNLRNRKPLRIFPHAFQGANAFYDRGIGGLLFGYFRADEQNPGPNLPGQLVFTCLSQDIISHEMTHAIVDRLRPSFIEPTNRDVAAFHEGFSDIVAIFQHFTFSSILRDQLQQTRGNLQSPNDLINLASEFGYATGSGEALRSAVDKVLPASVRKAAIDERGVIIPDPTLYETVIEPHERGSILVAAVFDGFFKTYQNRIRDLLRIATGGTGKLPDGDLHPDLVNRIAIEASRTAQNVLSMCIRAFEYLPPVDITFGDYLRALVTADFELVPLDEIGQRASMIEAFRARGIYPENVGSLAEESLLWESYEPGEVARFPVGDSFLVKEILKNAYEFSSVSGLEPEAEALASLTGGSKRVRSANEPNSTDADELPHEVRGEVGAALQTYARANAKALHLDPGRDIRVAGFHPAFRINPRGQLLVEMVAQFTQQDKAYKENFPVSGGLTLRGGSTVIASANGDVRYVISKPLPSTSISANKNREAIRRVDRQKAFVAECDQLDAQQMWADDKYYKQRIAKSFNFKSLHRGIRR